MIGLLEFLGLFGAFILQALIISYLEGKQEQKTRRRNEIWTRVLGSDPPELWLDDEDWPWT